MALAALLAAPVLRPRVVATALVQHFDTRAVPSGSRPLLADAALKTPSSELVYQALCFIRPPSSAAAMARFTALLLAAVADCGGTGPLDAAAVNAAVARIQAAGRSISEGVRQHLALLTALADDSPH